MGLFSGSGPTKVVVPLDQGTQDIIQRQYQSATKPNEQMSNEVNAGVGDSSLKIGQSDQDLMQKANSTSQDEGMLKAIRNQYSKTANRSVQNIIQQNNMNSSMDRAQRLRQASIGYMAQKNVETQNFAALQSAMNDAEMARAEMLSSVLGFGGVAAGMYFGSRKSRGPAAQPRAQGQKSNMMDQLSPKTHSEFSMPEMDRDFNFDR